MVCHLEDEEKSAPAKANVDGNVRQTEAGPPNNQKWASLGETLPIGAMHDLMTVMVA
jgi:hypothetical protein